MTSLLLSLHVTEPLVWDAERRDVMTQGGATHIVSQRVQGVEQQLPAQPTNVRQPRHLQEEIGELFK